MAKDKEYQIRVGRILASRDDLAAHLPPKIFQIFLRRGVPEAGTGKHSIENAQAAVAVEKQIEKTRRG
jgi:hypothetical protein